MNWQRGRQSHSERISGISRSHVLPSYTLQHSNEVLEMALFGTFAHRSRNNSENSIMFQDIIHAYLTRHGAHAKLALNNKKLSHNL
jgi:hypothetical protein